MAVLMKKNNQLVNVGYSVKQTELVQSKLPSVVDRSVTTIIAEDLQGVTRIGYSAFEECYALTSVSLPNTVTSIGDNAFKGCNNLTSITIPNIVTSIGDGAFSYCTSLTGVQLPTSLISLGIAFNGCEALTSITVPSGVTFIQNYTFAGCTSMLTINLPDTITKIKSYAFRNCTSLTGITIEATTPPTLDDVNAFDNTNNCPIYVPASSVTAYKNATNWLFLASRIQAIPT